MTDRERPRFDGDRPGREDSAGGNRHLLEYGVVFALVVIGAYVAFVVFGDSTSKVLLTISGSV